MSVAKIILVNNLMNILLYIFKILPRVNKFLNMKHEKRYRPFVDKNND